MKKIIAPLAIAIMVFSVSSCDFFRALAGRPTSDQFAKDTTCCVATDSTCCQADTASCCQTDSTCCKADTTACCCGSDSTCCHHSADSVCCGACGLVDSLAAEMVKEAAALADSIQTEAQALAAEMLAAGSELGTEVAAAAKELAAEMAAAAQEVAAEVNAAAQEIAAEMAAAATEMAIVNTVGQKTGFLQIDVKYNKDLLSNSVTPGYYILIGTFSVKANADRIEKLARNAGLNPVRLEYASGKTAVGVLRTSDISEAFVSLAQVKKYGFAPKDACILVVE